jgi:hypothetical protein
VQRYYVFIKIKKKILVFVIFFKALLNVPTFASTKWAVSKGLSRRHCEFLFPKNKQKKPTKAPNQIRSCTGVACNAHQIGRSFPGGVARNARTRVGDHAVVIGRQYGRQYRYPTKNCQPCGTADKQLFRKNMKKIV